ncbi:hypothetical protein CKM354_001214300 [Cercospora kikuchii]|uniref:Uncharacterized protein n=1 Tax=Cercospora kikuchii TaxID=84275 RepID=A0A9P3CQU6_9PEZI|nr:uncharacterized protein CKM354_001214300 [Cercospora kikuchii]GIZ49104.1 hypothetical protein CKM354_001214300 [Cercospora kikuchii]
MSFQADVQRYVEEAGRAIEQYLPQDRNSRLLLAGGAATVAGIVLFPLAHHFYLGRQLVHTHPSTGSLWASVECGEIENVPKDLTENAKAYRTVHDKVTKHIKDVTIGLSADLEADFTGLLRNNFIQHNRTPAGWFVWLAYGSARQRETFKTDYINNLSFVKGDLVNGAYEVVKRTPLRVELAIRPPAQLDAVKGLLVISLRPRNEGATLSSETIQWTERNSGIVLPLERWLGKFLHDLSARWVTLSGAQYLRGLAADHTL